MIALGDAPDTEAVLEAILADPPDHSRFFDLAALAAVCVLMDRDPTAIVRSALASSIALRQQFLLPDTHGRILACGVALAQCAGDTPITERLRHDRLRLPDRDGIELLDFEVLYQSSALSEREDTESLALAAFLAALRATELSPGETAAPAVLALARAAQRAKTTVRALFDGVALRDDAVEFDEHEHPRLTTDIGRVKVDYQEPSISVAANITGHGVFVPGAHRIDGLSANVADLLTRHVRRLGGTTAGELPFKVDLRVADTVEMSSEARSALQGRVTVGLEHLSDHMNTSFHLVADLSPAEGPSQKRRNER